MSEYKKFSEEIKKVKQRDDMWYRVKTDEGRFFVDIEMLAGMKADGKKFEVETRNKWLEGVVKQFDEDYSDGEVLDEVIKLIDEGKCNV